MNEMQTRDQHIKWIDCLKFFAIFAVYINHTYGILYSNDFILFASFFSVSTFVIAGGITAYRSNIKNLAVPWATNISRQLKRILIPYAIATACYLFYEEGILDLPVYLKHLLLFDKVNVFYFIVFYLQLALISRLLTRIIAATAAQKHSYLLFSAELAAALLLSAFCICYTFILPVHGGGKFLFGGTYLFLYFAGMIYSALYDRIKPKLWQRCALCLIYLAGMILCAKFITATEFSYDIKLNNMDALNPPGISIIVYSFMVVGFVRSLDEIVDKINSRALNCVRNIIGKLGQKSMYIFLFHMLAITVVSDYGLAPAGINIWLMRIIYTGVVIISGCAIGWLIEYLMRAAKRLSLKKTTV